MIKPIVKDVFFLGQKSDPKEPDLRMAKAFAWVMERTENRGVRI